MNAEVQQEANTRQHKEAQDKTQLRDGHEHLAKRERSLCDSNCHITNRNQLII
jgi:hypothetical protein